MGRAGAQFGDPLRIAMPNAMSAPTPKPPSKKVCPSCGWIMRLQVDPDDRTPQTDTADLSVVRFYLCSNRACEHAERAA
jgi:hypothetical protein